MIDDNYINYNLGLLKYALEKALDAIDIGHEISLVSSTNHGDSRYVAEFAIDQNRRYTTTRWTLQAEFLFVNNSCVTQFTIPCQSEDLISVRIPGIAKKLAMRIAELKINAAVPADSYD